MAARKEKTAQRGRDAPDLHQYYAMHSLRPYGSAGALCLPLGAVEKYYRAAARLWEMQALLKLRPVAGASGSITVDVAEVMATVQHAGISKIAFVSIEQ